MPKIKLTEAIPFSAQQMYDLVIDVDSYSTFLPWCDGSRRFRENKKKSNFVADMNVSLKGARVQFQTLDTYIDGEEIDIKLLSGPFKKLESVWKFIPVTDSSCTIDFYIDFNFKSRIMDMTIGSLFAVATRLMIRAFTERAKAIY